LAVVKGAIYLRGEDGTILWLAEPGSPMHVRCLHTADGLPGMDTGVAFYTQKDRLVFQNDVVLDFSEAACWKPPIFEQPVEGGIWHKAHKLIGDLCTIDQRPGFGTFLPALIARDVPACKDKVLIKALPLLENVRTAILAHELKQAMTVGRELIGLGEGLTPSGDDFMGGVCFTLFHLNNSTTEAASVVLVEFNTLRNQAKDATNAISYAFLKDLLQGNGIEPLYPFLFALLRKKEQDVCRHAARQLMAVGSSTGWDLLTGVLTGMLWSKEMTS
jgi:hypothetical protein